jgi:uncharacterized protein YukE
MPDFTVDPDEVHQRANSLRTMVADAYDGAADEIQAGGQIDAPGFGVALSPLEAGYLQRLDFLVKDVQGAADLCRQIGDRLDSVAGQYERTEDLHVAGFGGQHPVAQISYGTAFAATGGVQAAPVSAAISIAEITAILGMMSACAALSPTFAPAAIAASAFVAQPFSIASAGAALNMAGDQLKDTCNVTFDKMCAGAASGWKGEGHDAFVLMTTKIKAHLDELATYVKTLGDALGGLVIALAELWVALGIMTAPFLAWLVTMRAAEVIPGAAAAVEPLITAASAAMSSAVTTSLAALIAIGGLLLTLFTSLGKDFQKLLALPDRDVAGTPDLTEFSVGQNFAVN